METVAIIQARMASTRLPGKVLADVLGQPMLYYVLSRTKQASTPGLVVVATSAEQSDDPVARFCEANNTACFRGSQDDVLDRYYQAAKHFDAETVVRLTADCPLLDAQLIDEVVGYFDKGEFDYATNTLECTYPDGLDTEVFSFAGLERSWREAQLRSEREHVTPYMRNHPELFRLGNIRHTEDLSSFRWTVDEPKDLEFVRTVYGYLGSSAFGITEVLELLREHPRLREMNHGIDRNEGYQKSLREDEVLPYSGTR
jgi:spore coat polysaccharide biosynthesis protein SpsF